MKRLKYAVVGTGAIGGFYGGLLAKSGLDVHFVLRSDYQFVEQNGLRIDSVYGNFHLQNIQAYRSTVEIGEVDVILVCLKTTQNYLLRDILSPLIGRNTTIVLIQNGIGVEADVSLQFPNTAIVGGLGFICSNKIGPGHIAHLDFGRLTIGNYQFATEKLMSQILKDMSNAGVQCDISSDLMLARWRKLVWNSPFNGMTVVLDTTTDQLINSLSTQPLIYKLMDEVVGAANACGVSLTKEFAYKMVEMTKKMTPYSPSMKLDFDRKQKMEIEYIYSRPISLAKAAGYEMVHTEMLERQLLFIEEQRKSPI